MEPAVGTEASPEELKRALEWELGLESTDLRSHAWYHGSIPRQRAEELMTAEGVFLIRDCISRPGDFVLTCSWKGSPLHFVINKVVLQPFTVYERIQYQFEDDCFDTVPDLVTFYVGNRRPISAASGAVVTRPVNRSMPLSYYAARYGVDCQVHHKSLDSVVEAPAGGTLRASHCHKKSFLRVGSDPMLSPTLERRPWEHRPHSGTPSVDTSERTRTDPDSSEDRPPPKPSRVPSRRSQHKPSIPQRNIPQYVNNGEGHVYSQLVENTVKVKGEDDRPSGRAGNGAEREVQRRTELRLTSVEASEREERTITAPVPDPPSLYDLSLFSSGLLPADNKPLDRNVLQRLHGLLLECGPRVLANHLTRVDLDLLNVSVTKDLGLGVFTGLELLLLPQGSSLRKDLLERTECLKYFVAVTILTCSSEDERVELLNKWIQVAMDTKTAVGNLHGFTGIMQALSLAQIARLKATWLTLRQKHTVSALAYETKLRPTLRSMQDCSNPQAPNTCLPYLLSLITILETYCDAASKMAATELQLPWERTASDYGLQLLLQHLENGTAIVRQHAAFKRNSEIVFENVKLDDTLLEVFTTQFQLLFLWGAKGAAVASGERHSKLEQVLTAMSYRCEAPSPSA